jgi:oxalate decarboxylase
MTIFFPVDNAWTHDFNANDVGFVPSNSPPYIENAGNTDLVFLETFAGAEFMDVSLNQWLRRLPCGMVKDHLNFHKAVTQRIPAEKQEVFWRTVVRTSADDAMHRRGAILPINHVAVGGNK